MGRIIPYIMEKNDWNHQPDHYEDGCQPQKLCHREPSWIGLQCQRGQDLIRAKAGQIVGLCHLDVCCFVFAKAFMDENVDNGDNDNNADYDDYGYDVFDDNDDNCDNDDHDDNGDNDDNDDFDYNDGNNG